MFCRLQFFWWEPYFVKSKEILMKFWAGKLFIHVLKQLETLDSKENKNQNECFDWE